jgi:hypothetical protein
MRPQIEVEVGGAKQLLSLPIGGLEEIAKVNPQIEELWQALGTTLYRLDELQAVLGAALKWGGSRLTAGDVIETAGVKRARLMARDVLGAAIRDDDRGNAAAPEPDPGASPEKPDSASVPT